LKCCLPCSRTLQIVALARAGGSDYWLSSRAKAHAPGLCRQVARTRLPASSLLGTTQIPANEGRSPQATAWGRIEKRFNPSSHACRQHCRACAAQCCTTLAARRSLSHATPSGQVQQPPLPRRMLRGIAPDPFQGQLGACTRGICCGLDVGWRA